jgi:hypothetical protein
MVSQAQLSTISKVSLAEFAMKKSACRTQVTSPQNGKVLQVHGKLFQNPYRTATLL